MCENAVWGFKNDKNQKKSLKIVIFFKLIFAFWDWRTLILEYRDVLGLKFLEGENWRAWNKKKSDQWQMNAAKGLQYAKKWKSELESGISY